MISQDFTIYKKKFTCVTEQRLSEWGDLPFDLKK